VKRLRSSLDAHGDATALGVRDRVVEQVVERDRESVGSATTKASSAAIFESSKFR